MLANHKGEIPVFLLLIPFITGIWSGLTVTPILNTGVLYSLLLITALVFIILSFVYSKLNIYKVRWLGGSLVTVIVFLFGWIITLKNSELSAGAHFSKILGRTLIVQINNEPIVRNGLTRFTATVKESVKGKKENPTSGTLLIAIKDTATHFNYGDQLLIPAKYNLIDPPFVPAQFNYKRYLQYQNVFYQGYLYSKQYRILSSGNGNPLIAHSLQLRQRLVEKLKVNMCDTDALAVASTLILGYKADLSNDVLQAYSKTGTVHVLSVSGAHVAIVYILLMFALSFLNGFKTGRVFKAIIIITLIWYYSMLTGFSPAVCRAALMISFFISGKTFNRYINTLNLMAASAFVLLVYDPYFIADAGFQLSYLAVFGLIVFQPLVYRWFKFKNKWADKLWALCSVSLAAQVITFPLSAFYFHQFPVYFLVSNLFIIIPSAIIMYSGLAYLLLPQIPFLSKFLAAVLENTIIIMNKTLAFIEHLPFAVISKLWLNTWEYVLLYILLFCLFYFLFDKKAWLLRIAIFCCLLISVSISIKYYRSLKSNTIGWLNLGKHQGIIFKKGDEAVVLTDLHQQDKVYQFAIQPYLDSNKIQKITMLGFDDNLKLPWFVKDYDIIKCNRKIVFIANKPLKRTVLPIIDADFVYESTKKGADLSKLMASFRGFTLISGPLVRGNARQRQSKPGAEDDINYITLKRNNSLVTVSN